MNKVLFAAVLSASLASVVAQAKDKDSVEFQFRGLDYTLTSTEIKPDGGGSFQIDDSSLVTVRPEFSISANYDVFRTSLEMEAGKDATSGTLRQYFAPNEMFAVGAFVSAETTWAEREIKAPNSTTKTRLTNVELAVGPTARAVMEVNSDINLEVVADLAYMSSTEKGRGMNEDTMTPNAEEEDFKSTGFAFGLSGTAAIEFTKNFRFVPGVEFQYASVSDEDENETTAVSLSVIPVAFRAVF